MIRNNAVFLAVHFLLILPHTLLADVVHLKSGRLIEGTILSENQDTVVIEMAMGSVSYPKSKILKIERDAAGDERRQIVRDSAKFEGEIEVLKRSITSLFSQHGNVSSLKGQVIRKERDVGYIEQEVLELNSQYGEAMRDWEPWRQYEGQEVTAQIASKYNSARAKVERLEREIAALKDQQNVLRAELGTIRESLTRSQSELKEKVRLLQERRDDLIRRGCPFEALEAVERKLKGFGEIEVNNKVQLRRRGDGLFLMVRLNDNVEAEFMLDTGCTGLLITPALARRLKLNNEDYLGTSLAQIADGSLITTQNVMLESVDVSGHKASNIVASIAPDGGSLLLGMAYLRHFNFSIDPNRAILTLD